MATQNYVVISAAQRAALMALNGPEVGIDPRAVDNAAPGIGINLNPDALGSNAGEVVTLVGRYVAPKRIVDDGQYLIHAPEMVAMLMSLPWAMLENETIFSPAEEV